MTRAELNALRHPSEYSRFVLTMVVIVPVILAIVVASFVTFGALLLTVVPILFLVWLVTRMMMARFLGNTVRVSDENFPEIHAAVQEYKALFGFERPVDVYVYGESSFNALLVPLLRRKVILINADVVAKGSENEIRWLVARFVGGLASKHYRFMWLQVLLTSIEKLAVLNVLLYPYERAVVLSGDRMGLYAIDGDVESAVSAANKFLAGSDLSKRIALKGVLRQDREIDGSFFAWLVKALSPFPHTTNRVSNLLRFAAERYPARLRDYLAGRDAVTVELVRQATGGRVTGEGGGAEETVVPVGAAKAA